MQKYIVFIESEQKNDHILVYSFPEEIMKVILKGSSLVLLLFITACASMRTVNTHSLNRAPHYHGRVSGDAGNYGYFAVSIQPQMDDWFNRDRKAALRPLLDAMNTYLEYYDNIRFIDAEGFPPQSAPEISAGIEQDYGEKDNPRMILVASGPTKAWIEILKDKTADTGITGVLWISVGVQNYKVMQQDWKGSKAVEMGTGYTMPVPWLTSLDTPVEVLQVSGALLSPDGKILRSGAEGIIAKRTGFLASVFDWRSTITESDIRALISETVREDLSGSPPAWQAALTNLLAQLTGREDRLLIPEQ